MFEGKRKVKVPLDESLSTITIFNLHKKPIRLKRNKSNKVKLIRYIIKTNICKVLYMLYFHKERNEKSGGLC